jgi:hypothetical protein
LNYCELGGIDVMNYVIKEARSVEDAITEALVELGITSEEAVIEY